MSVDDDNLEPTVEMQRLAEASEGLWKDGALLHMVRMMDLRRNPLMMEFEVPPTSPYLVSSTRSLLWIPTSRNGKVRAAVRSKPSTAAFFDEVIQEVIKQGTVDEWGNIHSFSEEGLQAAIAHVHYYMADDKDNSHLLILANPATPWKDLNPEWEVHGNHFLARVYGIPVASAEWLDPTTVVVIPMNRGLVGFAIEVGEDHILSVIHNAARGIGVAHGHGSLAS